MNELIALWLPILVSAVAVFIASFLAWMVLPHHKPDFKALKDEDAVLDALRAQAPAPGFYMLPLICSPKDLEDPAKEKWESGPHVGLIMRAGRPNMGPSLIITFLFYLVVSICVAYIGTLAAHKTDFVGIFQVTSTAAVLAYAFGMIPNAVWFGRTFRSVAMDVIDGVIFGLITGAIFAWLWPV